MRTGTAVPVPIALSCGASGVNTGHKSFVIIKSWKRDPQADGSKDLDDAAKKAKAEVGGIEGDKGKGNGKKQPKKSQKPKELEKCTVSINALDSEGSLSNKSSGIKCAVPTYSGKMVGEVILKGDCTKFLCGLESSPLPSTEVYTSSPLPPPISSHTTKLHVPLCHANKPHPNFCH